MLLQIPTTINLAPVLPQRTSTLAITIIRKVLAIQLELPLADRPYGSLEQLWIGSETEVGLEEVVQVGSAEAFHFFDLVEPVEDVAEVVVGWVVAGGVGCGVWKRACVRVAARAADLLEADYEGSSRVLDWGGSGGVAVIFVDFLVCCFVGAVPDL
jgi:hypothetical protein